MATQHSWQSASNYGQFETANANNDLETGTGTSIPLEDLTNSRTKPSQAAELSDRINEDLKNGIYECPICSDVIASESPIWSCSACFHVYHYVCVKVWSSNQLKSPSKKSWNCPTCKKEHAGISSEARCWCQKQRHLAPTVFDNSCGVSCNKVQRCDKQTWKCTNFCSKQCHPGPCQTWVCMPGCIEYRTLKEQNITQGPTVLSQGYGAGKPPKNTPTTPATPATQNTSAATASATNGNATNGGNKSILGLPLTFLELAIFTLMFLGFHVFFGIWCYFNTLHRSQHINYRYFTDKEERGDTIFAWLGGLTLFPILWLFTIAVLLAINEFISKRLKLDERDRASGKTSSTTHLLNWVTGILLVVSVLWFPIVREAAPRHAFGAIMKHSCEGFDTRFNLGDVKYGQGNDPKITGLSWPGNAISNRGNANSFRLASMSSEKTGTYRMTVPINGTFSKVIAIDFFTKSWSINDQHITKFNMQRPMWWSRGGTLKKGTEQVMPLEASENLVRNGTWKMTGFDNIDLVLAELNLTIPYMWQFTSDYKYQPYMQIFRHDGMNISEIRTQSWARWTPKSADNVVMRTASFGYGMHDLEVCTRRNDYQVGNSGEMREGLHDDALVPLALMAAVRRQKSQWNGHSFLYTKDKGVDLLDILEEAGLGGQFDENGRLIVQPAFVNPQA